MVILSLICRPKIDMIKCLVYSKAFAKAFLSHCTFGCEIFYHILPRCYLTFRNKDFNKIKNTPSYCTRKSRQILMD